MSPHTEEQCLKFLKTKFGHAQFIGEQWKVISSIINRKRDIILVQKPGYGKSLCYQFPSVYLDTITIVISPFIALMLDQVKSLVERDIKACLLGSAQKDRQITADALAGKYNIVYMTPECTLANDILTKLRKRITLIAVDEAQFITRWGDKFRLRYRTQIEALRSACPRAPILAIASTATRNVRNDIIQTLGMIEQEIDPCLDRPNLELIVKKMKNTWADISPYLTNITGSIIIQCLTVKEANDLKEVLEDHDVQCDVYHRDMLMEDRERVQEYFTSGRIKVIVSTLCFYIYKPDIRLMIHYGVADDVETYHQQIGMAGRDGEPAQCVVFYDPNRKIAPYPKSDIKQYVTTTGCRRRFILSELEDECSICTLRVEERPNCCDNCRRLL